MRRALITGVAGQDGSYMAELLLSKGYEVYGVVRVRADRQYVPHGVQMIEGDMSEEMFLRQAVQTSRPEEIYNFGGISDLKTAFGDPDLTMKVNYGAVGILLDEAVKVNPLVRFLQASSSEIFIPGTEPLAEDSPRDEETKNPYARAKLRADREVIQAHRVRGVYACSAFLFNHESVRRTKSVTTKIIRTLIDIKQGKEECLMIGNIDMHRDWGFAGDYVHAMHLMLQQVHPEDMVLATGELHSVRECIDLVSNQLSLPLTWHGEGVETYALDSNGVVRVKVSPEFYKPVEVYPKVGNTSKAQRILGWKPVTSFRQLILDIVDSIVH